MGETDEKDGATPGAEQAQTNGASPDSAPTSTLEDTKETDKLLKKDETKSDLTEAAKSSSIEETKTNGEEIINIPEAEGESKETKKKLSVEEREVKPKKIPVGGIKIPGFFTRNKDKSKGEGDGAESELLENNEPEEIPKVEERRRPLAFLSNIRFRNPFSKRVEQPAAVDEQNQENKEIEEKNEDPKQPQTESKPDEAAESDTPTEAVADSAAEQSPTTAEAGKKNLLGSIKLPTLGSIIPKRLKSRNQDDIELGNGPNNRAGLASMETLDDPLKDSENNKDSVDKPQNTVTEEKLETVKLNEDKEAEKAAEAEADKVKDKRPILERLRSYKCSVDDLAIIGGIILFALLVILILVFALSGSSTPREAPVRDGKFVEAVTGCGAVEGVLEDSSFAFRGIPYAIPPVGERRWQAAELIDGIDYCWNGTLKAHNATPPCWQITANGTLVGVEDCLTLDVITPHIRYDNPLPVVVLIGAESFSGDSPSALRPSARYARSRDIVFVRPNFRIGIFGFLALKTLSESSHPPTSGNYGLSDIIAALKWIQLNIAHFGGDPKSVTLVGWRAGGTLVTTLAATNKTKNLFTRGWIASGASIFPGQDLAESEKANHAYLEAVGCNDAQCLRKKPDEELVEAIPDTWRRFWADLPALDENPADRHQWLVLDGQILDKHPQDAWKDLPRSSPSLVIGTTAHESHSTKLFGRYADWTPEVVRQHVQNSKIGQLGLTEEVLNRYNATYQGLVSMISDIRTICPLLTLARLRQNTPFYIVTQPGENGLAEVDADIQAILGRYEPKTYEQRRYMAAMQQLFYHFVWHGQVPQAEGRNKILDVGQDALPVSDYKNCDFWISKDIVPRYARLD